MELFRVIKPGFLSSLQDAGRRGYRQYGLAVSGAMDAASYAWGNFLLGNAAQSCSLEITFGQCQLEALADCDIVVTGADLGFSINDHTAPIYQAIRVQRGDKLHWPQPVLGARAYLAVAGGLQGEVYWGSRAVSLREGIGQTLRTNQVLSSFAHSHQVIPAIHFPQNALPIYQSEILTLYLLATDQFTDFSHASQQAFLQQTFRLSPDSNRVGMRLQADNPIATPYENMISEGMLPGSIQIPPDGQPIVMMQEAPTIGGYPKIGTLFNTELNKLAQAMPGQKIRFEVESLAECLNRQKRAYRRFYPYSCNCSDLCQIESSTRRKRGTAD